jgi:NAD(P)-dependent dehydrogenase (short-subunit alcohol dehydrogenase family)
MYAVSKLAEVAYTFLVAREEAAMGSSVICNGLCPGYGLPCFFPPPFFGPMNSILYTLHCGHPEGAVASLRM